ncbi:MAG: ArsC family reductase [Bdellovibrio bacteriovorus]
MVTLYGIANCDTMKKARAWLDGRGVAYVFHDFKKAGVDEALVRGWVTELGWEALVNRRGTTWRRLPESAREGIDAEAAVRLLVEHPSLIRRPVLDTGGTRHVGFSEDLYRGLFP